MSGMSQGERDRIAALSRKRAKVAKSMVGERAKALLADVEDQLSAQYSFGDELWADINRAAQIAVAEADRQVGERCVTLGIPESFRPRISVSWSSRGENAVSSRRTELRALAKARIEAVSASAKVGIDAAQLEVETELVRDGLTSDDAIRFLESMPTVEHLMPTVSVNALDDGDADADDTDDYGRLLGRFGRWEPPVGLAAAVLTPSTATDRETKRQRIAQALSNDPEASDRAIARAVGVDHKTVGKLRPSGESPQASGETPHEASS